MAELSQCLPLRWVPSGRFQRFLLRNADNLMRSRFSKTEVSVLGKNVPCIDAPVAQPTTQSSQ